MKNDLVCVLLSTYNGEAYLSTQLDSLLAQDYSEFLIFVRDDGSSDRTPEILADYCARYENLVCTYGANVGVKLSFAELLKEAPRGCGYYAFCDQDDFWLKDKISAAVKMLAGVDKNIPLLYCSTVKIVDQNLEEIRVGVLPKSGPLGNLLVENFIIGCSVVLNNRARELAIANLNFSYCMHDWWIALLVALKGMIVVDPSPRILYRQHSANSVGIQTGISQRLKSIGDLIVKPRVKFDVYAQLKSLSEFCQKDGSLDSAKVLIDSLHASKQSFFSRVMLVMKRRVFWRLTVRGQVKGLHFIFFGVLGQP